MSLNKVVTSETLHAAEVMPLLSDIVRQIKGES